MMDIIMIPFHDCKKWIKEGFRTRDAHLAQHFCKDSRVDRILVINRPTSLAEVIIKHSGWRTTDGGFSEFVKSIYKEKNFQISKLDDKLYCLDVFLPDFFKVAFEKKMWWYSAFLRNEVIDAENKAIEFLGLKDPILFLQNPMAIGAVASIKHNCFAFDAIDNWLFHPQMKSNHKIIEKNYLYVEQNADIIFTVSEALTRTFINNKNTHWIANGVDMDFFSKAIREYKVGEPITVVYVGKIQDRVDFDLIESCLNDYDKINFLFIGPVYSQKETVKNLQKKYSNIKFTGDIHYNKLPDKLRSADIAIIPHKVDSFTESMNPLKLYEYLAAGKPVVTTGVAGTQGVSEYVYITNRNEFSAELGKVVSRLIDGDIKASEVAASVPVDCTWENRCNEMINLLKKQQR